MSSSGYLLVPKPKPKRDSVSTIELEIIASNAVMDNIDISEPTIPSASGSKPSVTSTSTTKPAKEVPEYIVNLMLASKALAQIDCTGYAYKLRRIVLDIGEFDSKVAFAREFGNVELPDKIAGKKDSTKNTDFALWRVQAAVSALQKGENVELAQKIQTCWKEFKLSPRSLVKEEEEWTQV